MTAPIQAAASKAVPAKILTTGIKPTGKPHLGNYYCAIRPAIELSLEADTQSAHYFIADYHALNAVKDAKRLQQEIHEVAATWLACGLDPERVTFYQQSAIPEIFEITVLLLAYTAKGLMNRAHAYKAAVQANQKQGRDSDDGVNMGLFNYPIMMAADILAFRTTLVPIGKDQLQHLELTRDIAEAFNRAVGEDCLQLPAARLHANVETVAGIDGRKMSKSYGNIIPIFGTEAELRKAVMSIVTTSQSVAEPKDPDVCNIFALYKLFATKADIAALAKRYRAGGLGWGEAKTMLTELLLNEFKTLRVRYRELIADPAYLQATLNRGAEKARVAAQRTLLAMKRLSGVCV